MMLDPVELLRQMIQIPSINPMSRDIDGSNFGEGRLTVGGPPGYRASRWHDELQLAAEIFYQLASTGLR